jgi:hypothetical protein
MFSRIVLNQMHELSYAEVKMGFSRISLITTLILISASAGAFAQVGTSSLSGAVKDPTGAAIPNAAITLSGSEQSFTRTTKTGQEGEFVIPTLPPGSYRLKVTADGFVDREAPLELSSGQAGFMTVSLAVAGQVSSLTVEASTPLLQTTSASVGATVTSKQMVELPLLGRSFVNALSLVPGTIPVAPAGSTTNHSPVSQSTIPSVFGQRQKDNNFLMDGVENRDPNLLGVAIFPPPEAIAELKVDSGVGSSAYGHGSGATIDVVTKSGTNAWHGDAWEYFRNNVLDARSFFVPSIGAFRWNQFGGALGGPLAIPHLLSKAKGWYVFGYYEGVRIRQAANFTAFVPTAAQLAGDFTGSATIYDPYSTVAGPNNTFTRQPFAGNRIPASSLNATSIKLVQAILPAPNLPAGAIPGTNYLNAAGNSTDGNQWNARVDHQFGEHDTFFARYSGANNPSSGVSFPNLAGKTQDKLNNVAVSDTHLVSPHFILTARYGLITVDYRTGSTAPAGIADQTGLSAVFPKFQGTDFIPAITIPGYSGINFSAADIGPLRQHSGIGDAQYIAGEHTIDFGGSIVRSHMILEDTTSTAIQFATTQTSNFTSSTGNALASYLLGTPDSARRQIGGSLGDLTTIAYGGYVQDTWRHRAFTMNIGLRYDYNSPPVNKYGLGTFDYSTGRYVWDLTNPITNAPANISRGGITPDRNNFAPRLGLAYAATTRLVVRSSFGIFYNSFGSNYIQASQSARGNWPFAFPQALSGLNASTVNAVLPNPFPGNPAGSATPLICAQCLNVEPSSSRTPYVAEWTFSVQYQLKPTLAIEASYFGSKGTKLTAQMIDNTAVVPGSTPVASRQLYPQFAPFILNGFNEFGSWYDAGALRVDKRFSHGFSFLASYTYSKNLDYVDNLSNGIGGQPTSNPTRFNSNLNKGPAGFDIRNVFVLSNIWEIPGHTGNHLLDSVVAGWKLANVFTIHSGLPYSVFLGNDNENIGSVGGRFPEYPDLVGDPNAIASRSPSQWFNTAAFAVPKLYTIGTAGRNILRTDSLINDDLSLAKVWKFREKAAFELRGEFFNVFNHANFGYPGATIATAQFGTVSSTLNPGRQVQLAAKIHF